VDEWTRHVILRGQYFRCCARGSWSIKFHGSCNWVPITRIRVDNATLMQHVLFNDTRPAAPVRVITSIHVVVYCESGTPWNNALSGGYRRASLHPSHRTIPIPMRQPSRPSSRPSSRHLLTLPLASTTREEWSWSFPGWTVTNRVYSCQLEEACFTLCLPFVMLCKGKEFLPVAYSSNRPLSYVRDISPRQLYIIARLRRYTTITTNDLKWLQE